MTGDSERRLSDDEVSRILRKAVELQHHAGRSGSEGLSLQSVREIAAEIGIDPEFVNEADSALDRNQGSTMAALAGGPVRHQSWSTYDRALSEEDVRQLIDRIRAASDRQGRVEASLGTVEWKSGGATSLAVTVTRHAAGTDVRIMADRSGALSPVIAIPTVASLAIAGIIVDGLQPGIGGQLAILAGGIAGGLGVSRVIWRGMTTSFRQRLGRVGASVRDFMEAPGNDGSRSE